MFRIHAVDTSLHRLERSRSEWVDQLRPVVAADRLHFVQGELFRLGSRRGDRGVDQGLVALEAWVEPVVPPGTRQNHRGAGVDVAQHPNRIHRQNRRGEKPPFRVVVGFADVPPPRVEARERDRLRRVAGRMDVEGRLGLPLRLPFVVAGGGVIWYPPDLFFNVRTRSFPQ